MGIINELSTTLLVVIALSSVAIIFIGAILLRELYYACRDTDPLPVFGKKTLYTWFIVAILLLVPILNIIVASVLLLVFCVQDALEKISSAYHTKSKKIKRN